MSSEYFRHRKFMRILTVNPLERGIPGGLGRPELRYSSFIFGPQRGPLILSQRAARLFSRRVRFRFSLIRA